MHLQLRSVAAVLVVALLGLAGASAHAHPGALVGAGAGSVTARGDTAPPAGDVAPRHFCVACQAAKPAMRLPHATAPLVAPVALRVAAVHAVPSAAARAFFRSCPERAPPASA